MVTELGGASAIRTLLADDRAPEELHTGAHSAVAGGSARPVDGAAHGIRVRFAGRCFRDRERAAAVFARAWMSCVIDKP